MTTNPWGAIVAAFVTGFIAFIGMVISKENKTSEFRQAWITELRSLLSQFLSLIYILQVKSDFNAEDKNEAKKEINKVIADIMLHLNHSNKSKEEKQLTEAMNTLNLNVSIGSDLEHYFKDFIDASHRVLKIEWERVKDGERNYRWIKNTLLYSSVILFGALVITVVISLIKTALN